MSDQDWALLARQSRTALQILGWAIGPPCLPDETSPCGGTWIEHAVAHLVTLCAIAHHQLDHAQAPDIMIETIYAAQSEQLREACTKQHIGDLPAWDCP